MANNASYNKKTIESLQNRSNKRNFSFIISLVLFAALVFFVRNSADTEDIFLSPGYEYPVLYHLRDAQGRIKTSVLYNEQSLYGRILVFENAPQGYRYLLIDGVIQNADENEIEAITEFLEFQAENIHDVALIGLGAGTLLRGVDNTSFSFDVVEINNKISQVAQTYFGLPENLDYRIKNDDGRHYLATSQKEYDAIILDLCEIHESNAHLFTDEFFRMSRSKLSQGTGFVIATMYVLKDEQGTQFANSIAYTMQQTFPHMYILYGSNLMDDTKDYAGDLGLVVLLASTELLTLEDFGNNVNFSLNEWHVQGNETILRDENITSMARVHEPVIEKLRADLIDSYGPRILLEP